jgi:hypothetical protein
MKKKSIKNDVKSVSILILEFDLLIGDLAYIIS